jgi:hypothetical protein
MHSSKQFFTGNPAYSHMEEQILVKGSQDQPLLLNNDSDAV